MAPPVWALPRAAAPPGAGASLAVLLASWPGAGAPPGGRGNVLERGDAPRGCSPADEFVGGREELRFAPLERGEQWKQALCVQGHGSKGERGLLPGR